MDFLLFILALAVLALAMWSRALWERVKQLKEENEEKELQRKAIADSLRKKGLECNRLGKEVIRLTKELTKARRI